MALAARARRSSFSGLEIAWSGVLLMNREIYVDRKNKVYFISLGFFKYAAVGLPFVKKKVGGMSYLVPETEQLDAPLWIVCPGFQDDFLHIPTKIVPPACIPRELQTVCAALVIGEPTPILPAALKSRSLAICACMLFLYK